MASPTRQVVFYAVPPASPHRRCDRCPAEIYWIRTPRGARMPINCDVDGGQRPDPGAPLLGEEPKPGRGRPHFADCNGADQFRKPRR